jgi:hypothetical protein
MKTHEKRRTIDQGKRRLFTRYASQFSAGPEYKERAGKFLKKG